MIINGGQALIKMEETVPYLNLFLWNLFINFWNQKLMSLI